MKPAPTALVDYFNTVRGSADAQLVMADAFLFALPNGTTLAYTNSEITFTYGGQTYIGNGPLISGLKYKAAIGLEADEQTITFAARTDQTFSAGEPLLQALREGAFDGAEVMRYRVFWSDVVGGTLIGGVLLFKGRFSEIRGLGRTQAQISVKSDLVLLDIDMPRNVYQATCLHTLYDSGCTLSASAFATNGTVGSGSTVLTINWTGASLNFQQGSIAFTSGANAGVSGTINSAVAGVSLTLIYPLQSAPSPGDAFTVHFGCDHTPGTCKAKFNNLANFRAFPYVPPPQMAF
jgi:uncharacterized phage protein (TIGR02218 family)